MERANRNIAWADAFVDELVRAGVREAVIAPGSRSGPLVVALATRHGVRTFVHLDERAAAFFALGIGKATGRPAAVVTTSGTAAANLLPAAVEAAQSETPLLLLTADRPHRLRGTDANQTIDQPGLFGRYARLFHEVAPADVSEEGLRYVRALPARALAAALGPPAGPVHLNFPFEKPLEPTPVPGDSPPDAGGAGAGTGGRPGGLPFTRVDAGLPAPSAETLEELGARVRASRRGLIVAGPSASPERVGPAALRLAAATGYPLLADPLSGARFGPGAPGVALGAYDLLLRAEEAWPDLAPDLVLRSGPASSSGALDAFLAAHASAEHVVVDAGGRWKDHRTLAGRYLRADPALVFEGLADRVDDPPADAAWVARWRAAERAAAGAVRHELGGDFFEGAAVAAVAAALPDGALLFIGSSMPVRDLEAFAAPREVAVRVVGNRGASGIDGSVSTAFGAAAAAGGPAAAVIGDLALHHDLNGLVAARRFGIELTVVAIDNGGGGIFHLLPIRDFDPPFTSHFLTPHGLDFRHAARLYDLECERIEPGHGLGGRLAAALGRGGARLVLVPCDAVASHRRRREVLEAARRAVLDVLDVGSGDPA